MGFSQKLTQYAIPQSSDTFIAPPGKHTTQRKLLPKNMKNF
jgi:hypothetical protein